MTAQTDFFQQAPAPQLPGGPSPQQPLNGPPPRKRVFFYDNQYFEDPGPEYSSQDLLNFLAKSYPELENGTWTSRILPDGTEEVTFIKVAGEKGSVSPHLLAASLGHLQPLKIEAVDLLNELMTTGNWSGAELLEYAPQIEAGLQQADRIAEESRRMMERCLHLKPISAPKVPLGF